MANHLEERIIGHTGPTPAMDQADTVRHHRSMIDSWEESWHEFFDRKRLNRKRLMDMRPRKGIPSAP